MMLFCVTIWMAWRQLSAFRCHQHVATIVSATTRIDHVFQHGFCWVLKLGFALKRMYNLTLIDSHACQTDARH